MIFLLYIDHLYFQHRKIVQLYTNLHLAFSGVQWNRTPIKGINKTQGKSLNNTKSQENKTISDGGITVDFSIIKVHTSNWSSNSWGSSNTWRSSNSSWWDHRIVGDHRIPLDLLSSYFHLKWTSNSTRPIRSIKDPENILEKSCKHPGNKSFFDASPYRQLQQWKQCKQCRQCEHCKQCKKFEQLSKHFKQRYQRNLVNDGIKFKKCKPGKQ